VGTGRTALVAAVDERRPCPGSGGGCVEKL